MKNDPILQPYNLKHLVLKNRLMTSSHEPSYAEEGMPKDRYRLYHVERAKGGIALAILHKLSIPISFIGTGESYEDLIQFDLDKYLESIIKNN